MTCHLQDSELADLQNRGSGTVSLEILRVAVLDRLAMARMPHVDQIVDDQAAHVAKPELPADLVRGFHVGLEGIGLAVTRASAPAGVDVDGDERLGLLADESTAAGKRDLAGPDEFDLSLESVGMEKRQRSPVENDLGPSERDDLEKGVATFIGRFGIHDDGLDRGTKDIADGPDQDIRFGVELAWSTHRLAPTVHHLPEPGQIGDVALSSALFLPMPAVRRMNPKLSGRSSVSRILRISRRSSSSSTRRVTPTRSMCGIITIIRPGIEM